jgi:hypothetical protein
MGWARTTTGNNSGSTGEIANCQLNAAATIGSLLVCFFEGTYSGASTPTGDVSLSDGVNTWVKVFGTWTEWYATGNDWSYVACFMAINTSATQLTVSASYSGFNVSLTATVLFLDEFTGESGTGSFIDGSGSALWSKVTATGVQAVNSASITTTVNGDLICSFFYDTFYYSEYASTIAAGGSATLAQGNATNPGGASGTEYQVQTSSGAIQPAWSPTFSGSAGSYGDYVCGATVAFRIVGAGAPYLPWNQIPLMGPILAQ